MYRIKNWLTSPRIKEIVFWLYLFAVCTGAIVTSLLWLQTRNQSDNLDHQGQRQQAILICLSDWANQTSERANRLTYLSAKRTTALDKLIRTIPAQNNFRFEKALSNYLATSDAYLDAIKMHPPPRAPKFQCNIE